MFDFCCLRRTNGHDSGFPGNGRRYVECSEESSVGRISTFFGNFGIFIRAFAYILLHGATGLKANSEHAVLNANYLRKKLNKYFTVPYDYLNMHEFVCQGRISGSNITAADISKRLMDFGIHPPTNYFPLIVKEALMIEPTETESKQTLDHFVEIMLQIAGETVENPELLQSAPHKTPINRLDEVKAARELILTDQAARNST